MLTKCQTARKTSPHRGLHQYISRSVLLTDAKGRETRERILLPVRASSRPSTKKHSIADSIGAFVNDAGWDEFTAELDAYRKKQDEQES